MAHATGGVATNTVRLKISFPDTNSGILQLKSKLAHSTNTETSGSENNAPPTATGQQSTEPTPGVAETKGRGDRRVPHWSARHSVPWAFHERLYRRSENMRRLLALGHAAEQRLRHKTSNIMWAQY
mmetsp:Transcript_37379/g.60878  ORF Transcript_37379/g.60878 Transcript_37379/m.60878 type:complete len:126 (-) Transcript_37379:175-552(-)